MSTFLPKIVTPLLLDVAFVVDTHGDDPLSYGVSAHQLPESDANALTNKVSPLSPVSLGNEPSSFASSNMGHAETFSTEANNTEMQKNDKRAHKATQLCPTDMWLFLPDSLANDQSEWLANDRTPTEQHQKVYDWMESSTMPLVAVSAEAFTLFAVDDVVDAVIGVHDLYSNARHPTLPLLTNPSVSNTVQGSVDGSGVGGGDVTTRSRRSVSRLRGAMLYSLHHSEGETDDTQSDASRSLISFDGGERDDHHNLLLPPLPSAGPVANLLRSVLEEEERDLMADNCGAERDREVSMMGDASHATSRTDRKLAKKERRQRQKEGNVDEAFADTNNLGNSCEDEGMEEIVIPTAIMLPTQEEESDDAWASPILKAPSGGAAVPMTTANKRTNLRRGKRDLMTSWLATPIPNGGEASSSSQGLPPAILPPLVETSNSGTISDLFDAPKRVSSMSAFPQIFSLSSCNTTEDSPHLRHSPSSVCSRASGSRPRETFNSIRARRLLELGGECDASLLEVSLDNTMSSAASSASTAQLCSMYASPRCNEERFVTFNGDAYNLDAWDSSARGPFALATDSSVSPPRCASNLNSNCFTPNLPTFAGSVPHDDNDPLSPPPQTETPACVYHLSNSTSNTKEYPPHPATPQNTPVANSPDFASELSSTRHHLRSPLLISPTTTANITSSVNLLLPVVIPWPTTDATALAEESNCCTPPVKSPDVFECSSHSAYLHHVGARHVLSVTPSILVSNLSHTYDYLGLVGEDGVSSTPVNKDGACQRRRGRDARLSHASSSSMGVSSSYPQPHNSHSDVMRNYVTVDTLVHTATSYTHQLANPTSGAGHKKFRRGQERWLADSGED